MGQHTPVSAYSTRLVPPLGKSWDWITRVTRNHGESPGEFFIVDLHKHHENMGRAPHHWTMQAVMPWTIKTTQHQDCFKSIQQSPSQRAWTTQWAENTHLDGGPRLELMSSQGFSNPAHGKHGTLVNIRTSPKMSMVMDSRCWDHHYPSDALKNTRILVCTFFHASTPRSGLKTLGPGHWSCCPKKMAWDCLAITVRTNLDSLSLW